MATKFTHLHVHSHYSLLDGLPKIPELVNYAKNLGMDALALTDHGSLYGAVEFYKTAKKAGIKAIIGSEVYVAQGSRFNKITGIDDKRFHLLLLVKNETGYKNLVKLITRANLEGFYYKPRVDKELLRVHHDGLIASSACLLGEIPRAILSRNQERIDAAIKEYLDIFGKDNFYFELQHHQNIPETKIVNEALIDLSKKYNIGLIATNDVHYLKPEDAEAQDILMAVQTGSKLGEGDRLSLKADDFSMRLPDQMADFFRDAPKAIDNTNEIAANCNFDFVLGKTQLPHFEVPEGKTPDEYLKEICYKNLPARFGQNPNQKIIDRIEYELSVIKKTGFAAYLLIVQDFVNWAKQNGIVVGPGRGSAAGSILAYLSGITNIDPIKYDLIFERFMNPDRISMPDIDLDFADTRRDEVLKYVAEKYGQDHFAQIITFGTMAARAAIRDAGRAMGYSYAFCDQIAKLIPFNPNQNEKEGWLEHSVKNVLELKNLYDQDAEAHRLIDAARKLEGVARHASTHACGVVITKDHLTEIVPLQFASQDDKTIVTQYEMHAVEDLGLLKMDFLGLRNLSIIENTVKLIKQIHGLTLDIDLIPLNDKKTFELLQLGRTAGVFQLEGSGMTRYLVELKPTEMEDIIAMISLYRPGPIELIPEYIARKHGKKPVTYLHPALEKIFKNTYGIMIYQEQLMQAAQKLAGFTLSEADMLRKAIGKKIKSLLAEQRDKVIQGCLKNGISQKLADEFWSLIEPFDRYGFNRSHGACYALIGYQTAYLKAHHPVEFMAALMTAEYGDIERIAKFVEETRQMNIKVLPPDINESFKTFTVLASSSATDGGAIRFGLSAIKNVGENIVDAIIESRKQKGKFVNISDLIEKVQHKDLNKKSLESLIKCGALDQLGERNQLLASVDLLLNYSRENKKAYEQNQVSLFASASTNQPTIKLAAAEPATKKEKLFWEKELLGLYISDHPMTDYQALLAKKTILLEQLDQKYLGKQISAGGLISSIKKVITKSGQTMLFVTLENLMKKIEVLVFARTLEKNPAIWAQDKIVIVRGKLSERDGAYKILCDDAEEIISV